MEIPQISQARAQEIARLSELLSSKRGFSWLRLGDSELKFLIEQKDDLWSDQKYAAENYQTSIENAIGTSGLRKKDYARLLAAFENCDYLDYYAGQKSNQNMLPQLQLRRATGTLDNREVETSGIINDWVLLEFRNFLSHNKCLLYGAEADLLNVLIQEDEYLNIANTLLPGTENLVLKSPPHRGLYLSRDITIIFDDIRKLVARHDCRAIFLSLGGIAKIVAAELAPELGLPCIDWGSQLRALTYSGSDGFATWRSSNNPYLFSLPFTLYMRSVQKCWPDEADTFYLAKAHAQLALELQRQEVGKTFAADVHDPQTYDASDAAKRRFTQAYRDYRKWRRQFRPYSAAAQELLAEFDHWRRYRGVFWDGYIYQLLIHLNKLIRKCIPKARTKSS